MSIASGVSMRVRSGLLLLVLLAVSACYPDSYERNNPNDPGGTDYQPADSDGDGYAVPDDCDDADGTIHPGASESCNGVDDNCDDQIDEGLETQVYYIDQDGDGYGDEDRGGSEHCGDPGDDEVIRGGDCDDGEADVNPSSTEACDGVDNDCDGETDEGLLEVFYADDDDDGYGDPDRDKEACTQPDGYVPQAGDCDDGDGSAYPGGTEVCDGADNDCDGSTDEGLATDAYYLDQDDDGYGLTDTSISSCFAPDGYSLLDGDCNDSDATAYPGADEVCDGRDNDCDSQQDEGIPKVAYYKDLDGDGYGTDATKVTSCARPNDYVLEGGDCDDANVSINPGAEEICDGVDDDCDGSTDEGFTYSDWYPDQDSDSYGETDGAVSACAQPEGYVAVAGDCDDQDDAVYPGAEEVCDGTDNDCDLLVDEDGATTVYADKDEDGYGADDDTLAICDVELPTGYVKVGGDCDDLDGDVYPDAPAVCDGKDNDCDGVVDEYRVYFRDSDGDGYGYYGDELSYCQPPEGYVSDDTDCDDAAANIHPGADEVCDGADNDCDGPSDEDLQQDVYYRDSDGDGVGVEGDETTGCAAPEGYVYTSGDCNDADADIYPGAEEVCDGADNDCDGSVDEGFDLTTYYPDADSDGYGDEAAGVAACSPPDGYLEQGGDCDDADGTVYPGAQEVCTDDRDHDCDGNIDQDQTYYLDGDGDGYGDINSGTSSCGQPVGYISAGGDCNDADVTINPGADEVCEDNQDNDCDGDTDETRIFYPDDDGDGYGIEKGAIEACSAPDGYAAQSGDCDDTDPDIHPGASEIFDGIDNDCDGSIDEGVDLENEAARWITGSEGVGCPDLASVTGYGRQLAVVDLDPGAAGDDLLVQIGDAESGGFCLWDGSALAGDSSAGASFLVGEASGEGTAAAGDFNGDGYVDLVVSDRVGAGESTLYFFKGGSSGFAGVYTSQQAQFTFTDADGTELLGASLATLDYNGDGATDLLVGAPGANSGAGALFVFDGDATSGGFTASLTLQIAGDGNGDALGTAIAVDGTGSSATVWVSAPGYSDAYGALYALPASSLGGTSGGGSPTISDLTSRVVVNTDDAVYAAGIRLAVLGDTDGDGANDLLVAAGTLDGAGVVYLVPGGSQDEDGKNLQNVATAFYGEAGVRSVGIDLAAAGDVNGDGLADFLITGSQEGSDETVPELYVIFGSDSGYAGTTPVTAAGAYLVGPAAFSEQVNAVALASGDGGSSLVIGIPGYASDGTTTDGLLAVVVDPYPL